MYKLTALVDSSLERIAVVRKRKCVERKCNINEKVCSKNWRAQSVDAAKNYSITKSNHVQKRKW